MNEAPGREPVGVILSVDPDRFDRVVHAAREVGLRVTSEQPVIGALSGTVAEDRLSALAAVDGVESVDEDRTVRLLPPREDGRAR